MGVRYKGRPSPAAEKWPELARAGLSSWSCIFVFQCFLYFWVFLFFGYSRVGGSLKLEKYGSILADPAFLCHLIPSMFLPTVKDASFCVKPTHRFYAEYGYSGKSDGARNQIFVFSHFSVFCILCIVKN